MMNALTTIAGAPVEISGNKPVVLCCQNYCYIAQSDNIDVFLVKIKDGEPAGSRNFVFKAKKGDAVFPLIKETPDGNFVLIMSAPPGSAALKFETAAFLDSYKDRKDELEDIIKNWTASIAAAVKLHSRNKNAAHIRQEECDIEAAGKALFLNKIFSPQRLNEYGSLILDCLIKYFDSKKEIESHRLVEKEKMDASFMRSALGAFYGILKKGGAENTGYYKYENPLLSCCNIIGENIGVKIIPPEGEIGNSPAYVNEIARSSNIKVRQVVLKGDWWKMDTGALLAFREGEGGAPVALLPSSPSSYKIIDPAEKTVEKLTAKKAELIKCTAYTLYKPFPARPLGVFDLLSISGFAIWRRDLFFLVLMGLLVGILNLATPYATAMIFDVIIPGAEKSQMAQLAMGLIICSVSAFLFQMCRAVSTLRLEGKMDYVVQAAVWDRLLGLPATFFRNYNSGDLAMRAMGINQIRTLLSGTVLTTVMSAFFSVLYLFLLFYYNFKMAFFAVGLIIVAMLFTLACGFFKISYLKKGVELEGKISGICFQIINGLSKFKIAGAERRAFYLWADKFTEKKKNSIDSAFYEIVLQTFNSVYQVICSMVIFYLMIHYSTKDSAALSTGTFMSFYSAYSSLLGALIGLSSTFLVILQLLPIYERTRPILETVPEFDESKVNAGMLKGRIELSNVSFRYKKDTPLVLDRLDISVEPGEFAALVGPSGSGKSTVMRMLLGFETPESGCVFYDSHDLSKIDVKSVRRQIGVVLQNGRLLAGDIFTNIVGSYNLGVEDAWEAARMAGFDQDIEGMPMGMYTVVSEGGSTLSGGQRQRLLIARALVNKPGIVFFDEATSALDNATQSIVSESLDKLKATRIIIAHRLSTVIKADKIYVINKGRVVETGNFKELMAKNGFFAELAKRQM